MAKTYSEISNELKDWIEQQPVFFVASAPLQADGHINISPRGLDTLRVLNQNEVIILDLTGSGNETAAHLHDNGRLTIMFCAFSGAPRILRLYGQGRVILPTDLDWTNYHGLFDSSLSGVRQIFHLQIQRVQTSCGFGVPVMTFKKQRLQLTKWADKKGEQGLIEYRAKNNAKSIDGLATPTTIKPESD
jgi:hypothetical protein